MVHKQCICTTLKNQRCKNRVINTVQCGTHKNKTCDPIQTKYGHAISDPKTLVPAVGGGSHVNTQLWPRVARVLWKNQKRVRHKLITAGWDKSWIDRYLYELEVDDDRTTEEWDTFLTSASTLFGQTGGSSSCVPPQWPRDWELQTLYWCAEECVA
jgi:hypothetical protein